MVFGLKLGLPKASKATPAVEEPAKVKDKDGAASSKGHEGGRGGGRGALTVNEFVARTKRCREKGLEPTKPELIAYARYLGIDPITDGDLMWIADEALAAPLPSEWTEHHDSADRVFYYNVQTHASSWTHPLEQLHRDTYKRIVSFRSGDLAKEEQSTELDKLKRTTDDAEREAHKELQTWSEHTDEGGSKFFYNREKQVSVWTDPRPARCHALYLQMRALRELSKHCGGPALGVGGDDPRREKLRIQQSLAIGTADQCGRQGNSKKSRDDDNSPGRGGRGQPAADDSGEGREDDRRERRKEKKRHKRDKHKSSNGEELLDLTEDDAGGEPEGGHGGGHGGGHVELFKKPALDLKKPSLSAVEEVRAALGVAPPGAGGGGGGGLGGSTLPSISGHHGLGRLPTPPGDGLSSVGRAKVRAGIRLEPLRGGA